MTLVEILLLLASSTYCFNLWIYSLHQRCFQAIQFDVYFPDAVC
jgi:hypothetical protein